MREEKKAILVLALITAFVAAGLLLPGLSRAGDIDSPGPPSAGSGMYTIEDIYHYLIDGTEPTISTTFKEPTAGPGPTMKSTKDIYDDVKAKFDQCNATPDQVMDTVTFFSTGSGNWGPRSGSLTTKTLSGATTIMEAGYYEVTTLNAVDPDLATGNIKKDVSIFGVAGDPNVVDTSSGDAVAGEILNSKKAWVDGSEVTGSMTHVGQQNVTPGTAAVTITQGYHNGTGQVEGDAALVGSNIKSGATIFGVAGSVIRSTGDATAGDVLTGKIFSRSGAAGLTGTMTDVGQQVITPGTTAQAITQGYHDGTGYAQGDGDLISGNIKSGVTIFGVAGDPNVADTSSGDAAAGDILAGKKAWVDGSEVIGTFECITCAGTLSAGGRWCDNGDGTVTDMTTGLVWLKDASWGGQCYFWVNTMDGTNAHDKAAQLKNGVGGLTHDRSTEGDWRLPTRRELYKLMHGTEAVTSGNMQVFTGVQSGSYWSSTTYASNTNLAWYGYMVNGSVGFISKTYYYYVWPVRGGNIWD